MSQRRAPRATDGAAAPIPETVAAMAERIVRVARPLQIILFGSHARGDTHRWSDVDLLVIVPDGTDTEKVRNELYDALAPIHVPKDLVVVTPEHIVRRGNLVGDILRPALREGRVLYNASDEQPPSDAAIRDLELLAETGRLSTKLQRPCGAAICDLEAGPVTENERLGATQRGMRQAREDRSAAEVLLESPGVGPDPACYMSQQAAEKALKAVLVFLQIDYPLTHDPDTVRRHIPQGWLATQQFRGLRRLSEWSFRARYPGPWAPPTAMDAEAAARLARVIYEAVRGDLEAHGFAFEPGDE